MISAKEKDCLHARSLPNFKYETIRISTDGNPVATFAQSSSGIKLIATGRYQLSLNYEQLNDSIYIAPAAIP